MSLDRGFRFVTVLLAVMVTFPMAAKTGKIRLAIGEEENRQIISPNGKSTTAKIGNKVKEKDLIKTGLESRVVIALPDGSTISVEENSLVEFHNLNSENGTQTAMTEIKSGTVRFDAQPQSGKSSFKFKTGTATAAIRGTHGGVGKNRRGFGVFGLNSGLMDVDDKCGIKESVNAGEMVVITPECKSSKFKSSHAGDKDAINSVLKVLEKDSSSIDTTAIKKILGTLDNIVAAAINKKKSGFSCTATSVPDTVSAPKLPLNISCTAAPKEIFINEASVAKDAKSIEFAAEWAPSAIGLKKFNFTCIDTIDIISEAKKLDIPAELIPEDKKEFSFAFPCGHTETYYFNAEQDSINKYNIQKEDSIAAENAKKNDAVNITANVDELCANGSITINGTFSDKASSSQQAILVTITAGKVTNSLSIPAVEKTFSYSVPFKDVLGNWNAEKIEVAVKFPDGTSANKSIPISINKNCKAVNTVSPSASIQAPLQSKCTAKYSIAANKDDEAIVSIFNDETLIKEFVIQGDNKGSFKLSSGMHNYVIKVKDQAENEAFVSKSLRCLDNNSTAYVSIDNSRNPVVKTMRIPPNVPGGSGVIHHNMHIVIKNIKNNDFSQIESITAEQTGVPGNIFHLSNSSKAIDRLDYDIPVDLDRNTNTVVTVTVRLYNGRILKNSKKFIVNQKTK